MQKLLSLFRPNDRQASNEPRVSSAATPATSDGIPFTSLPRPLPQPIESLTKKERETLGALVEKLPNEVLSEIFFWCTPTSADSDQSGFAPRAALHLSHVCRHWRRVALNSPRLWTYTRIPIVNQHLARPIALMQLYLERAKMRPVFLDFDFLEDFSYYKPVLSLFERIIDVARESRPAWLVENNFLATHLEASSEEHRATREEWYFWSAQPEPSMSPLLLEGNGGSTQPSLNPSTGTAASEDASNFLGDYLQLANTPARKPLALEETSITLRALRLAIGSFVVEPYRPWAPSLTYLVIKDLNNYTNLTTVSAAQILATFPLLVHCGLHIDFEVAEQVPPEGPQGQLLGPEPHAGVELAFLKSLSLSWSEFVNTGPLLDALSVPSLTELELDGLAPEVDGGGGWEHLVRLLRRNAPPLTHLILTKLDLFHIDFLDALSLAPDLEGLWLEDVLLDEAIVRGTISNAGALGNLKTLVFLESYAFDLEVLIRELKNSEIFRVRRGVVEKIKAYVDNCGEVTQDHLRLIEELELDNLDLGPGSLDRDNTSEGVEEPEASIELIE